MKDNRGHNRFNSVTNIATTLLNINTFVTLHHKSVSLVMMSIVDSSRAQIRCPLREKLIAKLRVWETTHLYPSLIDPIFCTNREAMITLEGEEGKGGRGVSEKLSRIVY